ncbi:MAG: glucuronate isomerase [Clostridia bacterium]|nr:glucuronate isomerase [Clostridia bacterium]
MKAFMDENFLLSTDTARTLFFDHAKDMPIFDYHCHLNPHEIMENKSFRNVTELMLGGDHYKWRAMLSNGADESLMYGDKGGAPDFDKFKAYAAMLKYAIGNPLYHWTHLELRRVFGINEILNEDSARRIYDQANEMLQDDAFRCRALIEKFNVKVICTTDDPADSLTDHAALKEDRGFGVKVLPSFRPDKCMNLNAAGYTDYIKALSAAADVDISSFEGLMTALEKRLDVFHALGARVSDHGLNTVPFARADASVLDATLQKALKGEKVSQDEEDAFRTEALIRLGGLYRERGWVMQYHMNVLRNTNSRRFATLGPDMGFDSVGGCDVALPLSRLLDAIESGGGVPKTILYSLNPADNYVVGTMIGDFQGDVPGKVQMGSGWWFQDQRDGMEQQLRTLAALGLLGRFVGMLTDSRSFISYPRHEYFRRILCNVIGRWVENGEYPCDMDALGEIVRGISFDNARNYFGIEL